MVRRTTALALGCLAGLAMADDAICAVKECTVITTGKLCNRLTDDCPTCLSQLMGGKTARCTNATFDGCQGGTVCSSITTLPPTPTASTAPPNATTPVVTVPGDTKPSPTPTTSSSKPTTTLPKTTAPVSSATTTWCTFATTALVVVVAVALGV
ncbi:hypothetical protein SPRG_20505 [Saprolegnia parasitica CBS 223.65]|uniref:Uncharacterized protein n=1 Tax=Saprolegnia parasitica (strain CBS 223.65) TaxID=695850 RepID=A0A067CC34_SAPPC|nr:hypothetical protein SPRG_20505 [Saprolegnia parasitica CBS 223.65]KDO26705.1 hypothetical protein SPRG_20505 [Saprolegnia parasitica CBS 223.65]|eukprot:XP_012202593.1 hypothetical protein SPRG_20505 [Saprolegnia parasitica CBS 223.65]